MAAATGRVDEMVKEYLFFRGCTGALRTLESELKNDKDKCLRADRILEQLQHYLSTYNLASLRDYWNHLNNRFFSRLEQRYMTSIRKLEVGLLKLYIVNATQTNRHDKVMEFFEKMTSELQQQPEFKEWFCYPFIRSPEENSHFMMFFTKQWQDTFYLSLYNFLSVIINVMPSPVLLNFDIEHKRMKNLQEENDMLKRQLLSANKIPVGRTAASDDQEKIKRGANSMELYYDFSDLGEDSLEIQKQQKPSRKFGPFSASPLLNRKPLFKSSNKSPVKSQSKSKTAKSQAMVIQTRQSQAGSVSSVDSDSAGRSMAAGGSTQKGLNQETIQRSQSLGQSTQIKTSTVNHSNPVPIQSSKLARASSLQSKQSSSKDPVVMSLQKVVTGSTEEKSSVAVHEINQAAIHPEIKSQEKCTHSKADKDVDVEETALLADTKVKSLEMTQFPVTEKPDVATSAKEGQCPFLLLSQEDYKEHRSSVSYARFSSTGQYVASVDVDGIVKIWTWSPQPSTSATVMSKSAFLSLEWAGKQDRWLLLGNRSGNIRLFDVKEMKSFYEASTDSSYPRVVNLCASSSGTFVCSATVNRARTSSGNEASQPLAATCNGKLSLWDLRTMKQSKQLEIQSGPVAINCCSFNHNGQLLLTGGVDGMIRIFDMQQHKVISEWQSHNGEVRTLQFSSDETKCYSIGSDGKFLQWNMHKPGQVQDMSIHQGAALPNISGSIAGAKEMPRGRLFSLDSDGQYLLTCEKSKGTIYQMNDKMNFVMSIQGHSSFVTTVDWSPNIDTRVCLTGAIAGPIKISTLLSTSL